MKKKVLSLFSGCGGMDLGFEGGFTVPIKSVSNPEWIEKVQNDKVLLKKNSFETVFANDIRPGAKAAWEGYFKKEGVFHLESVVDLVKKARDGAFSFPKADVVTGGFPCQDFSVAGKRQGFDSKKTHLGQKVEDGESCPSVESRGMLYMWMRDVIDVVRPKVFIAENVKGLVSLKDVKKIIEDDFRNIGGDGYLVVEAKVLHAANYGVPQNRERVIFIGFKKDALTDEAKATLADGTLNVYPPMTHDKEGNGLRPFVTLKDAIFDLPEPEDSVDPSQKAYSKAKWYGKHCQGQIEINPDGISPTIRSEHHGNIEFRRLNEKNGGKIENERHLPQRRLSVRECARIQTFPDDYAFVTNSVSASEAYKIIGNAVPPLLAYAVAKRLEYLWERLFKKESATSGKENKKKVA
ncbi:MAG: DNA cytosine methyltransferase [Sulfurimonas sp.]